MTTITAQTTSILTKEERAYLAANWSAFHRTKEASAADMMLYALLRGKPASTGFTPITSKNKLANGLKAWGAYHLALRTLQGAINSSELDSKLKTLLKTTSAGRIEEIRAELRARIEQARKGA